MPDLRARAKPNIEFLGHLDDADLVQAMQDCVASVFASRDDFGLVPIEVQACGRPVLAFAGGGALHSVVPGKTGEFFYEPTADAIVRALSTFSPSRFDTKAIREHALQWDGKQFGQQMRAEALALTTGHGDRAETGHRNGRVRLPRSEHKLQLPDGQPIRSPGP